MTHTVDDTTQASTPGQIEISRRKYLDYIGVKGVVRLKYVLLLRLPANFLFKYFQSDDIVFDFIHKVEQFRHGCLNPTIVINKEKGLIATFTSLTSYGEDTVPVIKISKEPLHLITNIQISNGQKLPTVALYKRDPEDEYAPAWVDFFPKIANCFSDDLNVCNLLLSRMSEKGWLCLAQGLQQLDDTEKPGLYYVDLDEELVRNAY